MTTKEKVARRKLSLLVLAKEPDNLSRACKIVDCLRQQFHEMQRNFQTNGADGQLDRLPGPRGSDPNWVAAEVRAVTLTPAMDYPCHGALFVEQELRHRDILAAAGRRLCVWTHHGQLASHERLLRFEKATTERQIELSEEQAPLLRPTATRATAGRVCTRTRYR